MLLTMPTSQQDNNAEDMWCKENIYYIFCYDSVEVKHEGFYPWVADFIASLHQTPYKSLCGEPILFFTHLPFLTNQRISLCFIKVTRFYILPG